jgi:hypothetical protein
LFKITALLKKVMLVALVLSIGLTALPLTSVHAAGLNEDGNLPAMQPDNSRLEQIWARELAVYERAGTLLGKAEGLIGKVQSLIDIANAKDWDTSAVQASLNAFSAVLPAAQTAYANAGTIVVSPAGFDGNGKVTDRAQAVATVKALSQALKDTRSALNSTGKALREAIKAFREDHRPKTTP